LHSTKKKINKFPKKLLMGSVVHLKAQKHYALDTNIVC